MRTRLWAIMVFPMMLWGLTQSSSAAIAGNIPSPALGQEIHRELAALPYYFVFDYVTFSIAPADTVVLAGQVTRPELKSDAEAAVRATRGVTKVVNNIEVLPRSPVDDSIRWAAFKAIFDKPALQKYATQSVSPLRIIVKNREITIEGTVGSRFDRALIDASARSVREALGVTDDMSVASARRASLS
jgi:hyperosmotically inducible protein